MKISKRVLLAALFFIGLLVLFPIVQALVFTGKTKGKIVVDKTVDAPYLNHSKNNLFLVYYGYVGCTKVCMPILQNVSQFYESEMMAPIKRKVGFVFVNLMSEVSQEQPDAFAKVFHPQFEGVYLTQKELMRIDRDFNLFFSRSLNDPTEINHSDYVYLMEREKNGSLRLHAIYMTHPLNYKILAHDINRRLEEMQ